MTALDAIFFSLSLSGGGTTRFSGAAAATAASSSSRAGFEYFWYCRRKEVHTPIHLRHVGLLDQFDMVNSRTVSCGSTPAMAVEDPASQHGAEVCRTVGGKTPLSIVVRWPHATLELPISILYVTPLANSCRVCLHRPQRLFNRPTVLIQHDIHVRSRQSPPLHPQGRPVSPCGQKRTPLTEWYSSSGVKL